MLSLNRNKSKNLKQRRPYSLLAMVLILLHCWQHPVAAHGGVMANYNYSDLNPNIRCPGKNEENIWRPCKHGGYIENLDPANCSDRYVCYVGLDEFCYPGDKCADNAICTSCGICQKCDNLENCAQFHLCPDNRSVNSLKRLLQRRLMEFGDK